MNDRPMHVYWLHLQAGFAERSLRFAIAFETPLSSLDEIAEQLDERRIVVGSKLDVVDDGRGGKMIRRRVPFAFGAAGLVSIQPYDRPVWEPED